jgi:hypothetical protein
MYVYIYTEYMYIYPVIPKAVDIQDGIIGDNEADICRYILYIYVYLYIYIYIYIHVYVYICK